MKLPKYMLMESKVDSVQGYIIQTERPNLIGRIIVFNNPERDADKIRSFMMQIAAGTRDAVKVPGYWIFVQASGSLSNSQYFKEDIKETLEDMAYYCIKEYMARNYGACNRARQTGKEQF